MIKKIGITCLAIIFAFTILSSRTLAQSSAALESRISRLESDNFQMRSQISNLESQLSALRGQSPSQIPSPSRPAPPPVTPRPNRQVSSSDPMFDRLATLVIELRERIKALEAQVAELKRQGR
jgi:cell division protein FtsB